MRISLFLALAIGCCAAAGPRIAAAEGWPFCWPGAGRGEAALKTTNVSTRSQSPNVFMAMANGTKRFFTGTKSLLAPRQEPAKRRGLTATRRAARPERPKQNVFKRWFNPEPPPPPKTVEEWMSLEQVHP